MTSARAGKLTFRRVFPRLLRLLLTLSAVVLVGFYGAANAARRPDSGWAFGRFPVFVNLAPRDVRDLSLSAMRAVARDAEPEAARGRAELLRLGGAALPHVLPKLDTLEPSVRGKVALALAPLALRMRVANADDVASPERALLFWSRFWQDRSIDFRPTTVRRAVERMAERASTLRRDDVIHADTYALEALVGALGRVSGPADIARVARLHSVLMHVTARGDALPREPSLDDARRAVRQWQALWLEEGADFSVLEGPRRVAALVTETQFGKWLAEALLLSALHVLTLLAVAIATAASSALGDRSAGLYQRMRARVAATSASLVA